MSSARGLPILMYAGPLGALEKIHLPRPHLDNTGSESPGVSPGMGGQPAPQGMLTRSRLEPPLGTHSDRSLQAPQLAAGNDFSSIEGASGKEA